MKYSIQLRRMVGAFFFICCHSNAYRKLLKKLLSVASLISFCGVVTHWETLWPFTLYTFLNLSMDKKTKQQQKERCVEPLKKNIHSVPDYSSTCHGNFREKHNRAVNQMSNVFFQYKRKTVISPPIFSFSFFLSFS